jgi:hypothetical protein
MAHALTPAALSDHPSRRPSRRSAHAAAPTHDDSPARATQAARTTEAAPADPHAAAPRSGHTRPHRAAAAHAASGETPHAPAVCSDCAPPRCQQNARSKDQAAHAPAHWAKKTAQPPTQSSSSSRHTPHQTPDHASTAAAQETCAAAQHQAPKMMAEKSKASESKPEFNGEPRSNKTAAATKLKAKKRPPNHSPRKTHRFSHLAL